MQGVEEREGEQCRQSAITAECEAGACLVPQEQHGGRQGDGRSEVESSRR